MLEFFFKYASIELNYFFRILCWQPLRGAGSVSSLDSKHHKVSSSSKSAGGAMTEQQELERITHEKLALEAKVTELTSYQSEVMALRSEVQKLQVGPQPVVEI
jgi:hypothetical protein